jgi:CheY-like chemotaxis protein
VARPFHHEAETRRLSLEVAVDPTLPRTIVTDAKRLQQVLKNLLSNAFKFTEDGGVSLTVSPAVAGWSTDHPVLSGADEVVAFQVADTGIGIPLDKQRIIFEAFQQADAGTSRKFGGTGLGLAISRELAHLLGGEIQLRSTPGLGSTFTLYVPRLYVGPSHSGVRTESTVARSPAPVPRIRIAPREEVEQLADDREDLGNGIPTLLVVEDDLKYASVLRDIARAAGFKVVITGKGMDALPMARELRPAAITLDLFLPDVQGWTVLNHLKQNPDTRHIPVQLLTADQDRQYGLARGAFAFLSKPASKDELEAALSRIREYANPRRRRLLIVEDNPAESMSITELLGHDDIEIETAASGAEALGLLRRGDFDCAVLDLRLPDMSGFEVLDRLREDDGLSEFPVVVFTGKELTADEDLRLQNLARSVLVKGVESPERLLDETALFMHRAVDQLPPAKRQMLARLHESDDHLIGKKVLLVDDDVRNIFALSGVLTRRGLDVLTAGTGHEAIALLRTTPDIDVVLMDIMMPEMDGYQTMQAIRQVEAFRRLPIIALTARAMKGDRERCLEAGASDYLAKPVNTEQLVSALRIWLHR